MEISEKLEILADAAKYDASCASSDAPKRTSRGLDGIGASTGMGICHSFTPDGRCVSLLKILLTNFCLYDCQYCINRRSSNVPRARFQPEEVVKLTLDFYRRNYIDGLFLSSGIIQSSDYTMEQLVQVARSLRVEHQFRGYIHLKTIPDADPRLIDQAGQFADRLSVNIELPTEMALVKLAPEKTSGTIKRTMAAIRLAREEPEQEPRAPRFAPAGQSTQMIVGADTSDDHTILQTAQTLYGAYQLKRVYYSAFSPIPDSPSAVPLQPPPLMREHRLYQADFLLRSYGFSADELFSRDDPSNFVKGAGSSSTADTAAPTKPAPVFNLALDIDPKLSWALQHREQFPVDVNLASMHMIARVPGIGIRNATRLVALRRLRRLRYVDLISLRCIMSKAKLFVTTSDYHPPAAEQDTTKLRNVLRAPATQLSLL